MQAQPAIHARRAIHESVSFQFMRQRRNSLTICNAKYITPSQTAYHVGEIRQFKLSVKFLLTQK